MDVFLVGGGGGAGYAGGGSGYTATQYGIPITTGNNVSVVVGVEARRWRPASIGRYSHATSGKWCGDSYSISSSEGNGAPDCMESAGNGSGGGGSGGNGWF